MSKVFVRCGELPLVPIRMSRIEFRAHGWNSPMMFNEHIFAMVVTANGKKESSRNGLEGTTKRCHPEGLGRPLQAPLVAWVTPSCEEQEGGFWLCDVTFVKKGIGGVWICNRLTVIGWPSGRPSGSVILQVGRWEGRGKGSGVETEVTTNS